MTDFPGKEGNKCHSPEMLELVTFREWRMFSIVRTQDEMRVECGVVVGRTMLLGVIYA